ncbi:hypothetical protein MTO96_051911 [Rhipicephalus appendiculatus]
MRGGRRREFDVLQGPLEGYSSTSYPGPAVWLKMPSVYWRTASVASTQLSMRCYKGPVTAIVNAARVLHNFLCSDVISAPDSCAEASPVGSLLSGQPASRGRIGAVGAAVRDRMCCTHMGAHGTTREQYRGSGSLRT